MSSVTSVGAFVRKAPSAALCHSSLVVQRGGTDTPHLTLPHKELSGVVVRTKEVAILMVPETSA
jgi:hypothetical protein